MFITKIENFMFYHLMTYVLAMQKCAPRLSESSILKLEAKKCKIACSRNPIFLQGKSKILLYEQTFANTVIASLCGQAHTDEAPQQQRSLVPHAFSSAGARFSLKMSTPLRRDARAEPDPHQQ